MKTGRSLQEVMLELDRQNKAKKDYIGSAQALRLYEDGQTFEIGSMGEARQFGTTRLFHRQVASALGIPAKYYDLMQSRKAGAVSPERQRMVWRPGKQLHDPNHGLRRRPHGKGAAL